MPDREDGIDGGLSHDLEELEARFDRQVSEDSFHDVTEELNRRSKLVQFVGGQVTIPESLMMASKQGTPSAAASRRSEGGGRGSELP